MAALRVFICHAASNSAVAQRLANDLRGAGMDVLADAADLTAPGDFAARISRALAERDALILVLSPTAVASQWAPEAMTAAIARANQGQMRPPVLVQSAPVAPGDIPGLWTTYKRIDMASDYNRALPQLLAALGVTAPAAAYVAPPVQAPMEPPASVAYGAPVAGATPIYQASPAPPTPILSPTPYTPYPAYAPYTAGRPTAKKGPSQVGVAVVFGLLLTVVLTLLTIIIDVVLYRVSLDVNPLLPLLQIHIGDYYGLILLLYLIAAVCAFVCGLQLSMRTERVVPSLVAGTCMALVALTLSLVADLTLNYMMYLNYVYSFSAFLGANSMYVLRIIITGGVIGLAAGALGGLAGRGRASAAQSPSPKPPYQAPMGSYSPQQPPSYPPQQ